MYRYESDLTEFNLDRSQTAIDHCWCVLDVNVRLIWCLSSITISILYKLHLKHAALDACWTYTLLYLIKVCETKLNGDLRLDRIAIALKSATSKTVFLNKSNAYSISWELGYLI